ncbi:MAG: IS1182 family transposase [Chloroflexi bacterium]|nr:IS1182 family transposase [Chloroflexota bacterium]
MLGRRDPQRSFFDSQSLPHRVPADSFYGRMGAVSDVLFRDDDLEMMYCPDNGRPSIPPSLLAGVTLLQHHDNVSDAEAVGRTMFDQRWKVALNLPVDFPGFDPSSLSHSRNRLVDHGQERYAFSRFIAVGREAGFIPDRVTLLTDTTNVKGAGAVQDTYTLLRQGTRKLLKAAGLALPGQRQGLAPRTRDLVERYVDQDRKADIDWADPQQRLAHLQVLAADVDAALELAIEHSDNDEVRHLAWLLTKTLRVGDDLETDEQGQIQIAQGTAPDRIISLTEPEMRHGRKSKAHRFDGFKVVVTTEQSSELLLDIADVTAAGSDGAHLLPTIQRTAAAADVVVERVIGDGAFGSGENRAACADYPDQAVDLVAPVAQPTDPAVHKAAFAIDLAVATATCPQGHTVSGQPGPQQESQPTWLFTFPRATCAACPLFERCVRSKTTGRTVRTGPYEAELQAARRRQQGSEFDALYRLRPAVERKIGELVRHGLRDTRYVGEPNRQLQRLWLGAAVNLKRLFTLAQAQSVDLYALLRRLEPRQAGLMAA